MDIVDRSLAVEKVAQAIAWTTLTIKGKQTCKWPIDFSEAETDKFRVMANAAIEAMK